MKTFVLAGLLLSGLGTQAQIAPAATAQQTGTIEALDAENGFRSHKFGTPMSDIPGLKKQGKGLYLASAEPLKIGEAKVAEMYFSPHNGKLATVILNAFGDENCERLLAALRAQYGAGQQVSSSKVTWRGQLVTMTFELKQTKLAYFYTYGGSKLLSSCTVSINSNGKHKLKRL